MLWGKKLSDAGAVRLIMFGFLTPRLNSKIPDVTDTVPLFFTVAVSEVVLSLMSLKLYGPTSHVGPRFVWVACLDPVRIPIPVPWYAKLATMNRARSEPATMIV